MTTRLLLLLMMAAVSVSAQQPTIEVASVKVSQLDEGGWSALRPGVVRIQGATLPVILFSAFNIPPHQAGVKIDRGSINQGMLRTKFEIQVNGTGDPSRLLLKVLEDRFRLKWHTETRRVPVFALRIGPKLGLKRSDARCNAVKHPEPLPAACRATGVRNSAVITRSAGTIADLVVALQQYSSLPIIDETGLKGNYAWEYALSLSAPLSPLLTEMMRADVRDQLGLKLEETTGPWEVIVIDDIRMPTPN